MPLSHCSAPTEAQLSCSHLPVPTTSQGGDVGQNVLGENADWRWLSFRVCAISAKCNPPLLCKAMKIKMHMTTKAKTCLRTDVHSGGDAGQGGRSRGRLALWEALRFTLAEDLLSLERGTAH